MHIFLLLPFIGLAQSKSKTLNKIFTSDTIKVYVSVSACFGGGDYSLIIIKNNDHYAFRFTEGNNKDTTGDLSLEELQKVKSIIKHGLSLHWGGCTTQEKFTVEANNCKVSFIDDRCNYTTDDSLKKLRQIIYQKSHG